MLRRSMLRRGPDVNTRSDPLSYLVDEIAELKRKNLYRPLRIMTGAQAVHTVVDR